MLEEGHFVKCLSSFDQNTKTFPLPLAFYKSFTCSLFSGGRISDSSSPNTGIIDNNLLTYSVSIGISLYACNINSRPRLPG